MLLALTVLSVLAVWAFLAVLVIGLLVIYKALDGVRRHLAQIAMGVRAIETETAPLGASATTLLERFTTVTAGLDRLGQQLAAATEQLDGAAPKGRTH